MAVVAVVATLDMIRRLAASDDTIVAGAALPDDLRMVDGVHRCENVCRMAVLANVRRLDV